MNKKEEIEFYIWSNRITEYDVNFCNCITALENVDIKTIGFLKDKLMYQWNHKEQLLKNQNKIVIDLLYLFIFKLPKGTYFRTYKQFNKFIKTRLTNLQGR